MNFFLFSPKTTNKTFFFSRRNSFTCVRVMALFGVWNQCVGHGQCKKNGLIKCDGCSERDQFYYEIKHRSNHLIEALIQIDQWEEQTAKNARDRINQIGFKNNSNEQLQSFSEELRK